MYLGIEKDKGVVYEGASGLWGMRAVFPLPPLFDMQIGETPEEAFKKLIENSGNMFRTGLFREDSFDPVSMVRRGRVYAFHGNSDSVECHVIPIDQVDYQNSLVRTGGVLAKRLSLYQRTLVSSQFEALRCYAAIGAQGAFSLWRIVSIDRMHLGEELLTLRPHHSMGALPDLDLSKVSEPWKAKVKETVQKVVDVMNIANADSIIELCRHAASAALFAHFHEDLKRVDTTDLRPLSERIGEGQDGKRVVSSCGKLIADLHSRIKPNMQVHHDLRPVSDRDAELAIYSLSCILSDLGFTNEK